MRDMKVRLIEDRYLRDSARALVEADIQHLKNDLQRKGIGERMLDRVKEGATDVYEEAVDVADNNRGVLAALVAAIFVWFARNPILSLFGLEDDEQDEPEERYDEYPERRHRDRRYKNKHHLF